MRLAKVATLAAMAALPGAALADVTVGVLSPLTGRLSSYGVQFAGAVKLFEDSQLQLGGGEKMKIVMYDTRGDLTEAINLTRRLITSDKAVVVVGPLLSGESEVAFPIGVQNKTPIMSPSSAKPGVAAANRPYGFQFASTSEKITGQLMDRWLKTSGKPIKNVVVIFDGKDAVSKSDGTLVYPPLLKARGVNVQDSIAIQTGDMDYSAPVTRAKSLSPDGVVITVLHTEGGNLVRELRKQGMNQPILGNVGILEQRFIELGGPAAEGVMMATDYYQDNPAPHVVKWVEAYKAKNNNTIPANVGALMYDSLAVAKSCIQTQKVTGRDADLQADRDKMQRCLAGLKGFNAPVTGAVSMNDKGEAVRDTQIVTVRQGKFASAR